MKILLVFDEKFPIDKENFTKLIQQKSNFLEFYLYKGRLILSSELISKPKTFINIHEQLEAVKHDYDKVFCFTTEQYEDNFFFHGYKDLTIFSFYAWSYLTDLPLSNGVLYFIIDYLTLRIDHSGFRHHEITGCIYDFLRDKTGVDDGMRQSRFCSNCLKRISESLTNEDDFKIFEDLQSMMDHLSNASRWNKDILTTENPNSNSITKRKSKESGVIKVVIASANDTSKERKILLDTLEVRFRRGNHESHCGFRIIVNGWEDLASQPGYAQDVINDRIISESDFVIAVFRHKLGTPTKNTKTGTKRAESGTAEELLQTLDKTKDNHPIGMAYFFSQAPNVSLDNPDKKKIEKEWNRLSKFKETIKDKMIYKPYTDDNELISTILKDLEQNIISYIPF